MSIKCQKRNLKCTQIAVYFFFVNTTSVGIEIELTKEESKWYNKVVEEHDKLQRFLEEKYEVGCASLIEKREKELRKKLLTNY